MLLTGLFYAHFTEWGYLRYYWIIAKWLSTLVFVLVGLLWIVPLLGRVRETSMTFRAQLTVDPSFSGPMYLHIAMAAVQALLVLCIVIISIFRPWGRTGFKR